MIKYNKKYKCVFIAILLCASFGNLEPNITKHCLLYSECKKYVDKKQEFCLKTLTNDLPKNCKVKENFQELSRLMIKKNNLMKECIKVKQNFYSTINSTSTEHNSTKVALNSFCTSYNNLTFIIHENIKFNSCWIELNYLYEKFHVFEGCCSTYYNCSHGKKNVVLTKKIFQIYDKIEISINKCRKNLQANLEKLVVYLRPPLLEKIKNINYFHTYDKNYNSLYFNMRILVLYNKLVQKVIFKIKNDNFIKKTNTSLKDSEAENENLVVFNTTSTINQSKIENERILKKIKLPKRYKIDEYTKLSKNNEDKLSKNTLIYLNNNTKNNPDFLETMSKDSHLVNISKLNLSNYNDNIIKNKVLENILKVIFNTNIKLNNTLIN
uniref:Variable surface protein n=1 Tax=Strongyloides venezuelensis TaxID=75913 RepID=A0A0K0G5G9_STRVS